MVMDPKFGKVWSSMNGIRFRNQPFSLLPNQNLVSGHRLDNTSIDPNYRENHYILPDPNPPNIAPILSSSHEEESAEDCDFSDAVLRYINQMLMEEDMEDKTCMLQESLDLQAKERSLYEAIGKKYPPSPEPKSTYVNDSCQSTYDDYASGNYSNLIKENYLVNNGWIQNVHGHNPSELQTLPLSSSSYSPSNSVITNADGLADSQNSALQVPALSSLSQSIWQFRRGVEEASKFLPSDNELLVNFDVSKLLPQELKGGSREAERKGEKENSTNGSRRRKNPHREDVDLEEERSSKQAAVFPESIVRSDFFDKVLLHLPGDDLTEFNAFRQALRKGADKSLPQNGQSKKSNGIKGRGKKQSGKKEVVDLRTLLIQCAQDVAADDRRSASELLKRIRQHASQFGDGNQRLAHCLANALEARLAGTGSQIYKGLVSKRISAANILKAYYLYLAACPFRKLSNFVSNKTMKNQAGNSMRIHVIDFGVLYGFQWPTLIQRLSLRPGGPPKLRITGIEFPQPGFRPAERVEETGRRLAAYAEEFNVPFEYHAIAKKWETVQVEELKIDRDEFLVVNCLYRAKNLHDETVTVDSARNIFVKLIRKINPDLFIHGIVNGGYNAPFFVTRFREALFHFSAMFDMLETIVPREDRERRLIEEEILGREALNVIACEGWERVERPETYKQWQIRNLRAGFLQLPFDPEIVKQATSRVKANYHKDFVIDEDGKWLLHGWKGRIIYALSAWKPA